MRLAVRRGWRCDEPHVGHKRAPVLRRTQAAHTPNRRRRRRLICMHDVDDADGQGVSGTHNHVTIVPVVRACDVHVSLSRCLTSAGLGGNHV